MRGIAALAVVAHHFSELFGAVPQGYLAVDFFFALSGFVVVKAYGRRLEQGLRPTQFLRLRFIRFYPLYLLAVLLKAASVLLWVRVDPGRNFWTLRELAGASAFNLLLLPDPFRWQALPALVPAIALFPLVGPAWSLFLELGVNYLYALIRPSLTPRRLGWALAFCGASLAVAVAHNGNADGGVCWAWDGQWLAGSRVTFSFGVGCGLAWLPPFRLPWVPAGLLLLVLGAALCGRPSPSGQAAYDLGFIFVLSPILVLLGAVNEPRQAWAGRWMERLGLASYPIYLLHTTVGQSLEWVGKRALGGSQAWFPALGGLTLVGLLFGMALWLDAHYDRPARRWLETRFG
jgi:peptidoglycan/LPS O-acetylase OafA/YrhL